MLAVAGLALPGGPRGASAGPLQVLSPEELAVVAAIAERLCPGGGGGAGGKGLPPASAIGVAEKVDAFLALADPWTQADLKKLLLIFESAWGGLLLEGRITAFTALSPAEQDATLESWRRSSLSLKRSGYAALRAIIVTRYWSDPAIYRFTGYPGAPSVWKGRP